MHGGVSPATGQVGAGSGGGVGAALLVLGATASLVDGGGVLLSVTMSAGARTTAADVDTAAAGCSLTVARAAGWIGAADAVTTRATVLDVVTAGTG